MPWLDEQRRLPDCRDARRERVVVSPFAFVPRADHPRRLRPRDRQPVDDEELPDTACAIDADVAAWHPVGRHVAELAGRLQLLKVVRPGLFALVGVALTVAPDRLPRV